MTKFETKIKEFAQESSLETSRPETNGGSVQSLEKGNEASGKMMSREEALRKLREIALRNPSYEMDGDEIERVREIAGQCDSNDAFLFLRVVETIDSLKNGSFEEWAIDFSEQALELLKEIRSRANSALVRSRIDVALQLPFDHWSVEQKRDLLKRNWEYVSVYVVSDYPELYDEYYASDASVVQNISPEDIDRIFFVYRKESFFAFEHEAGWEMAERFHHPEFSERYDIPLPKSTDDIPEFEKRRMVFTADGWIEEIPSEWGRIIGPISDRYGVVYSTGFHTEFFFERDPGIERSETPKEKKRVEKLTVEDMLRKEGFSETGANAKQGMKDQAYLYSILIQPAFRKKIEDDFGIELKDFSVRVQVQFLNFLFEKNEEEVKRVIAFLKNGNGTDRLKSFLSLEQGGADMGEKILAIGEKLPKEAADKVFAKYAEMADRAGEARKNSKKDAGAIEAKLLERGKSLLSWIAEHAEEFTHDERLLSALNERLENLNAETILTVNALRAMKESGNTEGIKEFLDGSFCILKGADLSEKTILEMESLYRMSYPSDREKRFREKLVSDLRTKKIPDPNARFYAFFVGENGKKSLKAFCSFQDKTDEETKARFIYFGAFNVDEFFSGEKMGCLMMDESLEREAKEHMVRGDCIPEKPISEHYLEKRGFVGKSFSTLEGIDLLAIEREDKNAERYETKKMLPEDIIRESEANFRDASRIFLSVPERSFSRENIESTLKEGFFLTRLFRRGEGEGAKAYLAFEK